MHGPDDDGSPHSPRAPAHHNGGEARPTQEQGRWFGGIARTEIAPSRCDPALISYLCGMAQQEGRRLGIFIRRTSGDRPSGARALGSFVLADGAYFWEVTP